MIHPASTISLHSTTKQQEDAGVFDDLTFFTSASCARRICAMGKKLTEKIYSIGPACTKQLMEYGFSNIEQAHKPSYEELIKLV